MKELIAIIIAFFFYFSISYLVYVQLLKAKTLIFTLITVAYLIFTYFFFLLILSIDNYISPVFFKEFRQSNEMITACIFICMLTAFINIIAAMAGKEQRKEGIHKENNQVAPA